MAQKPAEPNQPKQSVRVGVAGYKTRAETGEKSPKVVSEETSTPLFGGTVPIDAAPIVIPDFVPVAEPKRI